MLEEYFKQIEKEMKNTLGAFSVTEPTKEPNEPRTATAAQIMIQQTRNYQMRSYDLSEIERKQIHDYIASVMNPHPWLKDLKAMSDMLEERIKIPHGYIEDSIHNPKTKVYVGDCLQCRKAYQSREEYKQLKANATSST